MKIRTCTASILADTRENGAVGRAAPSLTGAIRELATSHSSSTAMLMSAWNTRLHFTSGWHDDRPGLLGTQAVG